MSAYFSNKFVSRTFIAIFASYSFWLLFLLDSKSFVLDALVWGAWDDFFAGTLPLIILFYIFLRIFRLFNRFNSQGIAFLCSVLTGIIFICAVWIFKFPFPFDDSFPLFVISILAFSMNLMQLVSSYATDEERNNRTKILVTGTLLIPLVLFGALKIEDAQNYFSKKARHESIVFGNISDELIYTKNGNPIGLILRYSITPKSKDLEIYRGLDEFKSKLIQNYYLGKYESAVSSLMPMKVEIDPTINKDGLPVVLKKDQVYNVAIYAVPQYLTSSEDVVPKDYNPASLLAGRFENNVISSLEGVCIYHAAARDIEAEVSSLGAYSIRVENREVETKNQYDAKIFYESLTNEGLERCE